MFRAIGLGCLGLTTLAFTGAAGAAPHDSSQRARDVLDLTKSTTTTYSAYLWNRITLPNRDPVEEWSAEFHSGDLHRVETPRDRAVADCRAKTGISLSLVTGETMEGPQVASALCGINTNFAISSLDWVGTAKSDWGTLQRVRVTDSENVRQYDVSGDGVLIATVYSENRPEGRTLLSSRTIALEKTVPTAQMFDRSSLLRSFVPEEYKQAPTR